MCKNVNTHLSLHMAIEPHTYFTLTSVQAEKDPSGTWVNISEPHLSINRFISLLRISKFRGLLVSHK
jgi:hypothetical protein